jgi:hypothetical protein
VTSIVGRLRELDAAAFAAAAGMDLRLHDDDAAAETTRDLAGFGGVERNLAARHGHTVSGENGFTLIFVDFHNGRKLLMLIGIARGRQDSAPAAGVRLRVLAAQR